MSRVGLVLGVREPLDDERVPVGARSLASLLGAEATDLHVDGPAGDPGAQVLRALDGDDVVGAVLSARGQQPVLWDVVTRARVPLLVIPAGTTAAPRPVGRMLLPLDGLPATADAVGPLARTAREAGVDLVALHVLGPLTAPAFWDHAWHARRCWTEEFMTRHGLGDIPLDLRRGSAESEVLRSADRSGADVILVGWGQELSGGHGSLVRALLRTASVPVLLVGARSRDQRPAPRGPSTLTQDGAPPRG